MQKHLKKSIDTNIVEEIICNRCGAVIKNVDGIYKKEFLSVKKQWGYFSNKDGQIDSFELCENCYDKMISSFKYPIERKEEKELI